MGMVVRTNYSALNATRHLNKNAAGLSGSLEKLASGFKINKSADDASGLAISEKMKAQIKALDTASANCEDGISMIQTTEGYLTEVHDMLNRMVELSEKSANGTYETKSGSSDPNAGTVGDAGTDRDALQAEMNQLCAEVDRIAATANFNNVKLFNGDLTTEGYNKIGSLAKTAAVAGTFTASADAAAIGNDAVTTVTSVPDSLKSTNGAITGTLSATVANASHETTVTLNVGGKAYTATVTLDGSDKTTATAIDLVNGSDKINITFAAGKATTDLTGSVNLGTVAGAVPASDGLQEATTTAATAGTGLTLQIGETSNAADKLTVSVDRLHTDTLFQGLTATANSDGVKGVCLATNTANTVKGVTGYTVDISGQQRASAAAEALRSVINDVSSQRASLGAMQNRLDYTVNNLNTASENVTSANSRIRDTDMAKEMTKYTQMNVLSQAAQAMLAQANQQPSSVLQLLQ